MTKTRIEIGGSLNDRGSRKSGVTFVQTVRRSGSDGVSIGRGNISFIRKNDSNSKNIVTRRDS